MGYSPFDRLYLENRFYFLFLQVLRCFSSLRSLPCIARMTGSLPPGSPIRISADPGAFASPRGFSQLVTSFFASESLGILHAPFVTPLFLNARYALRFRLLSGLILRPVRARCVLVICLCLLCDSLPLPIFRSSASVCRAPSMSMSFFQVTRRGFIRCASVFPR